VPQVVILAAEVEAQHTEVVTVLGALHGGRHAAAILGPLLDHLVVRGGEAPSLSLGLLLG
jgi:hypothetical protein